MTVARRRVAGLAAAATIAVVAGGALVACFDLLHSTADVRTACELDASQPGCPRADGPTDFCAWSADEADRHAAHACAWLGACEAPMGRNAFGPCVFRARMAYDCAANPHHRPRGAELALWDCLQRAPDCAAIDACIFSPSGPVLCGGPGFGTTCSTAQGERDIRVACADGSVANPTRAAGENCTLWGQTCIKRDAGSAECAGQPTDGPCQNGCESDNLLHWCGADDGGRAIDQGIDCTGNGAGSCGEFPAGAAAWAACRPDGDGGACVPSGAATCGDGGGASASSASRASSASSASRATMCPAGTVETLDCAALLGAPGACAPGALDPPFDWTSPCALAPSQCTVDSCDGGALTSCERGAAFTLDCAGEELGACRMVTAEPGAEPRAACAPPAAPASSTPRAEASL